MKLKTFAATYLLFLFILYSRLAVVSVYLTDSQAEILKEKSIGEYRSVAAALSRDLAVLQGRNAGVYGAINTDSVQTLIKGYIQYYRRYNIEISVSDLSSAEQNEVVLTTAEVSFIRREHKNFIRIAGMLPEPSQIYRLEYLLDITKNITDMRNIQKILLVFAAVFSVFTAVALYLILSGIFKPLFTVAETSKKIADGRYGERLDVKGKTELSKMASSFNRMAEEIEKQILVLKDEAVAKQQFADNLAHEIRTPLTSVYGYAEYMQRAPLNEEEIIESAQRIMDEADHMNKIADSLLLLATLRNYKPVKNKISVARLFDEISRSMDKFLREKNIRLVYRIEAEFLNAQEDLIKSLLLNLCSNALKSFCGTESGVIRLEAIERGTKTVISVTDNGRGIPEEHIAKVTEPFYRVEMDRGREETPENDRSGAGLGLALCKQIAEAHGAEMIIESTAGKGTAVKIIFTNP